MLSLFGVTLVLYFTMAHQGVMTDRRHSLKRGDRLSKKEKKEPQTTAYGKKRQIAICVMVQK